MPLVLGAAAIAFIFLAFLTLITIYWLLTKWHDFVQGIPVVGGALSNVAQYLRDRNLEIINAVLGVARNLISWSEDRVNDGFRILNALWNGALMSQVSALQNGINGLQFWKDNTAVLAIGSLQTAFNTLNAWRSGFVDLNINALNFWRTTFTDTINNVVIPSVNALVVRVDYIANLQIPTIQARLGVAENTLHVTLPAEIAETKTDVSAVQRELARTTTAPGTGLMDRVHGIEGTIGQVLPWAAAIGLSIPIARTLARVGRNPCTCLEEDGQTDMLPMLMYLLVEAG